MRQLVICCDSADVLSAYAQQRIDPDSDEEVEGKPRYLYLPRGSAVCTPSAYDVAEDHQDGCEHKDTEHLRHRRDARDVYAGAVGVGRHRSSRADDVCDLVYGRSRVDPDSLWGKGI